MASPGDLIIYQFSRSKIEKSDFAHFLGLYAMDKLPTGRRLREMMNTMTFVVEGYDDDPRAIHSIPEVRAFYAEFSKVWPYSLYFCNLELDELRAIALCCVPSISSVSAPSGVAVHFRPMDLTAFLRNQFLGMNEVCDRADMFEAGVHERTKAVFEYFGLPFGAPPPSGEKG